MELTGEPSGSHSGLTVKPIVCDLNLPPPKTFESNLSVNDHPEPLETGKRTWDDMTAASSSAHVEPGKSTSPNENSIKSSHAANSFICALILIDCFIN
jgi:hypothetical protein